MRLDVSALTRRPTPSHSLASTLALAGVSVSDAARVCGCARQWLSSVLHGHKKPGRRLAARMAALESELRRELARQEAAGRG